MSISVPQRPTLCQVAIYLLLWHQHDHMPTTEIVKKIKYSRPQIDRALADLLEVGLINRSQNGQACAWAATGSQLGPLEVLFRSEPESEVVS